VEYPWEPPSFSEPHLALGAGQSGGAMPSVPELPVGASGVTLLSNQRFFFYSTYLLRFWKLWGIFAEQCGNNPCFRFFCFQVRNFYQSTKVFLQSADNK